MSIGMPRLLAGVSLLAALLPAADAPPRMRLNVFEYYRGANFPVRAPFHLRTGTADLEFGRLRFVGLPFQTDNSVIPNAFLIPLLTLRLKKALQNFTDPYYGLRVVHFFRRRPRLGLGVEFIHFKIYLADLDQRVRVRGQENGAPLDRVERAGDRLAEMSISHGVNHLSLVLVHRWLLRRSARVPDGRWQPFVQVAAGPLVPHLQLTTWEDGRRIELSNRYFISWRNVGLGFGAGARLRLGARAGVYGEYKLTHTRIRHLPLAADPRGGVAISFPSHHLAWGASWIW